MGCSFYYIAGQNRKGGAIMQEDVENRAVALAIRGTKLTAHGLKTAITKYLCYLAGR